MELKLTNEELESIKYYIDEAHENIDQLLSTDSRLDVVKASDDLDEDTRITYKKEEVTRYLETITEVYNSILTVYYDKERKRDWEFYYLSNISDIQKLRNEPYIDRFLQVHSDKILNDENLIIGSNQVIVKISGSRNIPYIDLDEVLGTNDGEILISLFTEVKDVKEIDPIKIAGRELKAYNIILEPQELQSMSNEDKTALYDHIISNRALISSKLIESADLEKENTENYEKIRDLEKKIADMENDINMKEEEGNYGESQKELDSIALDRENEKLDNLKDRSASIFETINNNTLEITNWKKNITVYLMAECYDIKKVFDEKLDKENMEEEERVQNYELKERINQEDLKDKEFKDILEEVKNECSDNEVLVKRLISDINRLINRQQNFAKIAQSLESSYSALNNGFEMRKNAEELEDLLDDLKTKVETYENSKGSQKDKDDLLKISEVNNQITTLINYLNNPKTVAVKSQINRFDEMIVVEENELKRDIARTILNIRGEAELKKLRDDTEIIENKNVFMKFIGIFTGKNKLDDFMLDQIDVREKSIKKTLSKKLKLDYNYSIHELVAEIRMFIEDNKDDDLVSDDIMVLEDLENEIKKNFVIIESRVDDIIAEKEGKNMPIEDKVSKKELIEMETYRFLNKYGYDIGENTEEDDGKDMVYTDTTAKEIARISEYIKTADVI